MRHPKSGLDGVLKALEQAIAEVLALNGEYGGYNGACR
jgi:hypothetical protein